MALFGILFKQRSAKADELPRANRAPVRECGLLSSRIQPVLPPTIRGRPHPLASLFAPCEAVLIRIPVFHFP